MVSSSGTWLTEDKTRCAKQSNKNLPAWTTLNVATTELINKTVCDINVSNGVMDFINK